MYSRNLLFCVAAFAALTCFGNVGFANDPVRSLPLEGVTDLVRDPTKEMLYVGLTGVGVYPFNLATGELTTWPPLIDSAKRVDISPNGTLLAGISDSFYRTSSTTNWLVIHDLTAGQSRTIEFPRLLNREGGGFDVAFVDNKTLLVTTTFNGSGWVPLRKIDIESGHVSVLGQVRQDTSLEPNGDRSVIAFAEGNASNGPFGYYDSAAQAFHSGGVAGHHISEIAPDRTGTRFAIPSVGGVEIFDASFNSVGRLPAQYPQRYPLDAIYSPVSDVLYVSWTGSQAIGAAPKSLVAYDAQTLQVLETLDARSESREFRQLLISRNGRELFVRIGIQRLESVDLYDVSQYGVPEPESSQLIWIATLALICIRHRRANDI